MEEFHQVRRTLQFRGGSNNGHGKWESTISMLEEKVINQKRQMSVFNTVDKPGLEDEESYGSDK